MAIPPINVLTAYACLVFGLMVSSVIGAAEDVFDGVEWNLKRDRKGIQVYTGNVVDSNDRAVFSTMQINASRESVVALLLDFKHCRRWAKTCKEAKLVKRLSRFQSIIYSLNDLPFPIRDRDGYSTVSWSLEPNNGTVTMNSDAVIGRSYAIRKGVIRVRSARIRWRIVPVGVDSVIVESYAHIDPNGRIPAWFSNIFIIDEPYKALRGMRSVLQTGAYDQADIAFLKAQQH